MSSAVELERERADDIGQSAGLDERIDFGRTLQNFHVASFLLDNGRHPTRSLERVHGVWLLGSITEGSERQPNPHSHMMEPQEELSRVGQMMAGMLRAVNMFLLALTLAGCAKSPAPPPDPTIAVAVASDLQFAFEEILLDFHRVHPEIVVRPTFGSSGSLYNQILNRAPFDMYLAGDVNYVKRLAEAGFADPASIFVHGKSQLVVFVRQSSTLPIDQDGVRVVLDPSVEKVAIANPKNSPYGRAAKEVLETLKVFETVERKMVYAENVAQAAQMVENGSAQVGIVAMTLALAPPLRAIGKFVKVADDIVPTMFQGGGILTRTGDRATCEKLRDYLLSARGRAILSEYGLLPPEEQ